MGQSSAAAEGAGEGLAVGRASAAPPPLEQAQTRASSSAAARELLIRGPREIADFVGFKNPS
jgi:hypothetical protein